MLCVTLLCQSTQNNLFPFKVIGVLASRVLLIMVYGKMTIGKLINVSDTILMYSGTAHNSSHAVI